MLAAVFALMLMAGTKGAAQTTIPSIKEALRYEGKTIARIDFSPTNQPMTAEQLAIRLPFHTGSIFRERDLRVAIQALFSTGRYNRHLSGCNRSGSRACAADSNQASVFCGTCGSSWRQAGRPTTDS